MLSIDKVFKHSGEVVTRFPPEPNGYLHIGHAKAAYVNFNYAKMHGGKCYLRFDDTNPCKEKNEYVDSAIEDISWLGYEPWKITYTSDYFDELCNFALDLIKKDKAYICHCSAEVMKHDRLHKIECPHRSFTTEESLKKFTEMKMVIMMKVQPFFV